MMLHDFFERLGPVVVEVRSGFADSSKLTGYRSD